MSLSESDCQVLRRRGLKVGAQTRAGRVNMLNPRSVPFRAGRRVVTKCQYNNRKSLIL